MQPLKKITKSREILNRFIRATFKMIGRSEVRTACHQNSRTVHAKSKEICHPARCMMPPRKITKSSKILNKFIRAIFDLIGQSEFQKNIFETIALCSEKQAFCTLPIDRRNGPPEKSRAPPAGAPAAPATCEVGRPRGGPRPTLQVAGSAGII